MIWHSLIEHPYEGQNIIDVLHQEQIKALREKCDRESVHPVSFEGATYSVSDTTVKLHNVYNLEDGPREVGSLRAWYMDNVKMRQDD